MRKFSELEISGIALMPLQGQQTVEFFQNLMRNHNDILDFLAETHPKQVLRYLEENKIEVRNSTGRTTTR